MPLQREGLRRRGALGHRQLYALLLPAGPDPLLHRQLPAAALRGAHQRGGKLLPHVSRYLSQGYQAGLVIAGDTGLQVCGPGPWPRSPGAEMGLGVRVAGETAVRVRASFGFRARLALGPGICVLQLSAAAQPSGQNRLLGTRALSGSHRHTAQAWTCPGRGSLHSHCEGNIYQNRMEELRFRVQFSLYWVRRSQQHPGCPCGPRLSPHPPFPSAWKPTPVRQAFRPRSHPDPPPGRRLLLSTSLSRTLVLCPLSQKCRA